MADVKVNYAQPVDPPIESVTLTLSEEEARAIADMCGWVAGVGRTRDVTDNICSALRAKGISVNIDTTRFMGSLEILEDK